MNIESALEETLWVEVKAKKNITLGVVYRPSYTDLLNDQANGTTLEIQLTEATFINSNVIVIGDLNCDTESDDPDKDTRMLNDVFNNQSMKQLITKPTRIDPHKDYTPYSGRMESFTIYPSYQKTQDAPQSTKSTKRFYTDLDAQDEAHRYTCWWNKPGTCKFGESCYYIDDDTSAGQPFRSGA